MINLNQKEFIKKTAQGNVVTLYEKLAADWLTPVAVLSQFLKEKHLFLFESMEGGERWGRYSFIGFKPQTLVIAKNENWRVLEYHQNRYQQKESGQGPALKILEKILKPLKPVVEAELPKLCGAAVGWMSYDYVRQIEKIPQKNKESSFDDFFFGIFDQLILFDNLKHEIYLVKNVFCSSKKNLRSLYLEACSQIAKMRRIIEKPLSLASQSKKKKVSLKWKTLMTPSRYEEAILKAKSYVAAGDVFQVQISRQWEAKGKIDSFQLYRKLRSLNPSPYLFYMKMEEQILVGSSPEIMVRKQGSKATIRPIAGTRRRGRTAEEEILMEKELMADPKERAEHIMLVDLGRNDLGRVCNEGTVKVSDLMTVEKYSHVMHLVSNVEGELKDQTSVFDLIEASFPAGTLTGAPKIRAMEIIDELEPVSRGLYGGAVGYIDFQGNSDMAITIRSVFMNDKSVYLQSAGGVVYDSLPALELKECENKARAMKQAIEEI